ncbi:MAG: hypothetical protein ACYDCM_01050 [Candidatus Acidiferrales bacterium]
MGKRRVLQVMCMALTAMFLMVLAIPSFAQTTARRKSVPVYDPATEVTMKGTVEAVKQLAGPRGWAGTHLGLKTDAETLDVHVGPSWFLAQSKISFAKGDQIEVTGSKVKFENSDAVIAREIKKGDKTITLRNAQGIPAWSGGHRRS